MKKTLILLLCILTLSVIFTSCGEAKDTAADTTANTTEDAAQSGISIIKPDGTTDYVLVYDNTLDIYSSCQDLKAAIYNAYSINMFPKKATDTEASEYEILVGQTNRDESSQLQSSIGEDEYAIRLIGKKIVINSLTEGGIKEGIKEFINMYVNSSNENFNIPEDLNIVKKTPEEVTTPTSTQSPSTPSTPTGSGNVADGLKAGWNFKSYKASNGTTLPYQIHIPESYDANKKYAVVLFMHGLGSVGTTGNHIYKNTSKIVENIPQSKYKDEVIILAPQHPKGEKWVEVNYKPGTYDFDKTPISKWLAAAKELVDATSKDLPVDTNRIYGFGNSMGAFATIYMAMTYPDLYAAIVPVAGGCDPTQAALIKDVPIWLFHGNKDTTVNIVGSQTLYDNLKALGAKDAKLTVFNGVGHAAQGCFVAAADTSGLLDWMFSHSK